MASFDRHRSQLEADMPFDRSFPRPKPSPRTLFLSDLHLGALSARADEVLRFLRANPADVYVLVGDILDLWHPMLPYWSAQDQAVIDFFRVRHASGARLIYIRGNHDPDPSRIPAYAALPAEHLDAYVHQAPTGKRFLVIHGDEADGRLIRLHVMTRLGSLIDHGLRRLDTFLSRLSFREPKMRGFASWLLTASNDLRYRGRSHEQQMIELARARGLDGVVCGHFHIAALHDHFGLTYANCGDWVDSMTALLDEGDGVLRLIDGREAVLGVSLSARHSPSDQKALTQ